MDAVVHLAGENLVSGHWTEAKKRKIHNSSVCGTRFLCEQLAHLSNPPKALISASAVEYYGDRGPESLSESSNPGLGFLPDVCQQWEEATQPARDRGIRVVNLRLGVVLSPKAGALAKMLTPFRLGVGGSIGSGQQFMSWIALDDLIGVIHHALIDDSLEGPVNAVAPQAVTNAHFSKTLGNVLGRPAIFPMPVFAARLKFGELADELLVASQRVRPERLLGADFKFHYPDLELALRHMLGAHVEETEWTEDFDSRENTEGVLLASAGK